MKKNNAKRTVVVIALIALMAIPSMFAFFTDQEAAIDNEFTIGNVEITLVDEFDDADAEDVVGGDVIDKNVTVRNDGASPAWVFVKVTEPTAPVYKEIAMSTDWTEVAEGVYGYKEPVAAGDTAPSLFTQVEFADDLAEVADRENASFDITVEAYAIQSEGFDLIADAWAQVKIELGL